MRFKRLKLKLRMFLGDHIFAMVSYRGAKSTATCSPMIGQLYHDFGINQFRVVIMTHQDISLEKCWKLFRATLSHHSLKYPVKVTVKCMKQNLDITTPTLGHEVDIT